MRIQPRETSSPQYGSPSPTPASILPKQEKAILKIASGELVRAELAQKKVADVQRAEERAIGQCIHLQVLVL